MNKNNLEKKSEFETLFITGIGMAITREGPGKNTASLGKVLFSPAEEETRARQKHMDDSYKIANKKESRLITVSSSLNKGPEALFKDIQEQVSAYNTGFTLEEVYPYAKSYFLDIRDNYIKDETEKII